MADTCGNTYRTYGDVTWVCSREVGHRGKHQVIEDNRLNSWRIRGGSESSPIRGSLHECPICGALTEPIQDRYFGVPDAHTRLCFDCHLWLSRAEKSDNSRGKKRAWWVINGCFYSEALDREDPQAGFRPFRDEHGVDWPAQPMWYGGEVPDYMMDKFKGHMAEWSDSR